VCVWFCLIGNVLKTTYDDKYELEDGAGNVPSPVRVTEEGSKKRENVNCASPLAHVVGCISIVLTHHSRQKQHQIHSHSKECQRCKTLIHCNSKTHYTINKYYLITFFLNIYLL